MRILVTGAAGFIGSHLCDRLRAAGHFVCGIDDGSTGDIERLGGHDLVHDVRKPITSAVIGSNWPEGGPFDQIYHLACPASPAHYQKDPKRTLETAFLGTRNVLDAAQEWGARVVSTSSSEIHGEPLRHPQDEGLWAHVNPVGNRGCYEIGKLAGESLACAYIGLGVDVRIARIFNTYGPRLNPADGRVVSNFIVQTLRGQSMTIYGDGTQTRSLCYVDDMVSGLIALMGCEGKLSGPVNLGNPVEMTILDIANAVSLACAAEVGADVGLLTFHDLPVDDPTRRCPDITLAKTLLGWEPAVALEEGLKRTVRAFMRDEMDRMQRAATVPA